MSRLVVQKEKGRQSNKESPLGGNRPLYWGGKVGRGDPSLMGTGFKYLSETSHVQGWRGKKEGGVPRIG